MRRFLAVLFVVACSGGAATIDEGETDTDVGETDIVDTDTPDDTDLPAETDLPDTDGETDVVDTDPPIDTADTDAPDLGACDNTDDLDALAAAVDDIESVSQECAFSCLRSRRFAACVSDCVEADIGISAPCADCFGRISACITNQCLVSCIDPDSTACEDCRVQNCEPGFVTCAGITPP